MAVHCNSKVKKKKNYFIVVFTLVGIFYSFPYFFFLLIFHRVPSLSPQSSIFFSTSCCHIRRPRLPSSDPPHRPTLHSSTHPCPSLISPRPVATNPPHLFQPKPPLSPISLLSLLWLGFLCVCFHIGLVAVVVDFGYGSGGG